jgi:hypothetical protein
MGNFFTATSILTFLACLLLGGLYAWILYGNNDRLPKKLKLALSVLRTAFVAGIAWLIFAPLVKQIAYTLEKPIIVLAIDNSISVAQLKPRGFDQQRYEKDLKQLAAQLSSKYEVKMYSFGDSVKTGLNFSGNAKLSNASALIDQLNDELLNRNVGAVIIASDGIFNRGGNPLYEMNKIKAPFYTIALGDTIPKRDVLVANINYNNLAYLDNEFTLDVQVQAYASKGETIQLTVFENGRKVKEQPLDINADGFIKDVQIKLKANQVGVQQYTVSLTGLKNEITTKNNTQTVFIEVIDARQKIVLAAAAPHPDLATIKQAIEQQKHYEVTIILADELNTVALDKYSLAILYQLPNINQPAPNFLAKIQESKLSLWYIIGAQSNVNALNQVQKRVSFDRANGNVQEVFPVQVPTFTAFSLEPAALKQLTNYDPLLMPFANVSVNGSFAAAFNQRIGRINTQNPLLFFMEDEGRKTGFLLGEGIWKWKLAEAENDQVPLVAEIITKAVQYLAVKDDKRKFKVYSSKNTYEENESIVINAALYNEAYEAVNTPDVTIQIKNTAGKIYNYTFSKFGSAYRLAAGTLPQGKYTYLATTTLGNKSYTATGAFFVNAIIAEYQQTTANHQLLYTMAQQSNGKMFMPQRLLGIAELIENSGQVKTISYEDRKYEELINLKWLFALIVILLTAEWLLRKRNGEV